MALPGAPARAAEPDLSSLLDTLAATPEGEWVRVNQNNFSSVWTPVALRPLVGPSPVSPSKIIEAWSSFAWDSNRGDLILYGGGHANYAGNDVYRWRGTTGRWERASLPSQITTDTAGQDVTVDGPDYAPVSAHTYDNNVFLPNIDRFLTYGGAKYALSGPFTRDRGDGYSRRTGPYAFDPELADGNKVGGLTGSHVQREGSFPEIVGGEMWQNRDMYANIGVAQLDPGSFIEAASAVTEEGGYDVVYITGARSGTSQQHLYKYTYRSAEDPTQDSWRRVGSYFNSFSGQGAGTLDTRLNLFVRTAGTQFVFWNLNTPGTSNGNQRFMPQVLSGAFSLNTAFGLDYDPTRDQYLLWRGDGRVWALKSPGFISTSGWTITQLPTPALAVPSGNHGGRGVLGKWKYVAQLDAFMGLVDPVEGNVWLYKPIGWEDPRGDDGDPTDPTDPTDPDPLEIVLPSVPAAFVGSPFSLTLTSTGGTGAKVWSAPAGSLPPGLVLSTGGVLAGTPTAVGLYAFTVQVEDAEDEQATRVLTVSVGEAAPVPEEFIVDDLSPNTQKVGSWPVSLGESPYAGQSVYSESGGTFRWIPNLPAAGTYEVFVWWTYRPNRSESVPYEVRGTLGSTTIQVNQRNSALAGKWHSIGKYVFDAGSGGYVEVSSRNGQASADAVRFVRTDPLPLSVATGVLPDARVGESYGTTLLPAGGTPPYAWTAQGQLPSGITLSPGGMLSGSPVEPGEYTLNLELTDGLGASASRSLPLKVTEAPPVSLDIIVDDLASNTQKTGSWPISLGENPYAGQSVFSDGGGVFRWMPSVPIAGSYDVYAWWTYRANRATNVPYRINHAGGVSTVIVNQRDTSTAGQWRLLGRYDFSAGNSAYVEVSSQNGQASADAIRLVFAAPAALSIDTGTLPQGLIGQPYAVALAASGGKAPYSWSATGALPEWLTLSSDGVLSGTPDAEGVFAIELQVSDADGTSVVSNLELRVSEVPAIPPIEAEVIVDNLHPNTVKTGTWANSGATGPYAGNSQFSNADGRFKWLPGVPVSGTYRVYAWWTAFSNRSTTVPYRIAHVGGESTVIVDQVDPDRGGQWQLLGVYEFDAANPGYVEVSSENGQASADAIRLVLVEPAAPVEFVVDDLSPDTERVGLWPSSLGANPHAGYSSFSESGGLFRWRPKLPEAGEYEVFVRWTYRANRSTSVPYRIGHASGVETALVNQRNEALGGQWQSLGSYQFNVGSGSYVEVSSENGQASADAVMFRRK